MTKEHQDALRLLLSGLATGDSTGSSSEFVSQSKVPALYAKLKDKGWPFNRPAGCVQLEAGRPD
jgi:ADP-ribosylglycohydrolase